MFLGKLWVLSAPLTIVSASRVVDGETLSTTVFTVKAYNNLHHSELKCFARANLSVRTVDGATIPYTAGMEMQLSESTGFQTDPSPGSSLSWSLGVRQVATAKVEVVDSIDRTIPYFNCVVYNEYAEEAKKQCGAASNGAVVPKYSEYCSVELTNLMPRVRVIFKIDAWVFNVSKHVATGIAFEPTMNCYGKTELSVEKFDQTEGKIVPKGDELMIGGTKLGLIESAGGAEKYEIKPSLFVTFTDFKHKYDGFTCFLMNNATALNCGLAESWDQDIRKRQEKLFKSCAVTIVRTHRQ